MKWWSLFIITVRLLLAHLGLDSILWKDEHCSYICTAKIEKGLLFKKKKKRRTKELIWEWGKRERNLETIFGVRFTLPWPVGRNRHISRRSVNIFCVFDFFFTVLKKCIENSHQTKVIFSKQESLPCVAPLLTTVEETPHVISAQVRGHFPKWLNGSLLRIGPGKFEFGKDR